MITGMYNPDIGHHNRSYTAFSQGHGSHRVSVHVIISILSFVYLMGECNSHNSKYIYLFLLCTCIY